MTSDFTKLRWPVPAPKDPTMADESTPAPPGPAATAEPVPGGPDAATSSG